MKTILTHFYNEEYLLPWWLEHHKKYFDHGILIDYGSTDRSVEIVRDICPTWQIFPSKFKYFDAHHCDYEIMWYERQIPDWRIALTVTEFLIGDLYSLMQFAQHNVQHIIATLMFAEYDPNRELDKNKKLWDQCYNGNYFSDLSTCSWAGRSLHNYNDNFYPAGRHYNNINTNKALIFKYSHLLVGEPMIKRKLQIQNKISEYDKTSLNANHHCYYDHGGLTKNNLHTYFKNVIGETKDCTDIMNSFLKYL